MLWYGCFTWLVCGIGLLLHYEFFYQIKVEGGCWIFEKNIQQVFNYSGKLNSAYYHKQDPLL